MTQDELKRYISYDPHTGLITYLRSGKRAPQTPNAVGYLRASINGKRYTQHRLAWLYVTGAWPRAIDHANRDKTDNRFCNLRECSDSQNIWNSKGMNPDRRVLPLPKGVYKNGSRYRAQIWAHRKAYHLGYFDCPMEAGRARERAAAELHGEFACYE